MWKSCSTLILSASSAIALAAFFAASFAEAKQCGVDQYCECYYGKADPFVRCAERGQHGKWFTKCGTGEHKGCEDAYNSLGYNYSKCIPVGAYNDRHKCRDG